MQESAQTTLYEQLGGQEAINAVVEEFYARVLADEKVRDLFKNTDMEKQKRHQAAFIAYATGGPNRYQGRTIKKAHEGLGITEEQFMAVATHLSDSLKHFNVPQHLIDQVIELFASLKGDVVEQ
ncbi:hemoglobin [Planifilum fimeticola]|jgi:hemoglobin|uniref:Group 1 truncated hemoglobin n=1 Tax=Planifilum fimeticola TaxID=201975 RepID=A0A2T0LB25_9BACL|nr:group 1 truncated hemoglobin [Planifilum fimeticola]PRX39033.1 hemoglobin [Planifilum fimeticola]